MRLCGDKPVKLTERSFSFCIGVPKTHVGIGDNCRGRFRFVVATNRE
jgi:hypothetical protein